MNRGPYDRCLASFCLGGHDFHDRDSCRSAIESQTKSMRATRVGLAAAGDRPCRLSSAPHRATGFRVDGGS